MKNDMQKRPLLGLTLSELQNVVKNLGMPGFSAKQIASWLYDKKVTSIDEMSNLSLKHRELLKEIYEVGAEAPSALFADGPGEGGGVFSIAGAVGGTYEGG